MGRPYESMTVSELRALAEQRGVTVLRNDTKSHTIERLRKADEMEARAPDGDAYTTKMALIDLKQEVVDKLEEAFAEFNPEFANSHEARIIKNYIVASLKKIPELQPGPQTLRDAPAKPLRTPKNVSAEQVVKALEKREDLYEEVMLLMVRRWNAWHQVKYQKSATATQVLRDDKWYSVIKLEIPDDVPEGPYKVVLDIACRGSLTYRMTYGSDTTEVCSDTQPANSRADFQWEGVRHLSSEIETFRVFHVWVQKVAEAESVLESATLTVSPL